MSTKNIYRPQSKTDYSTYLYILPAFIFYIIFVFFPLADTFLNSFTQWNGISEKKLSLSLHKALRIEQFKLDKFGHLVEPLFIQKKAK